jgi:CheY-like chemotaxis protein
MPTLLVIDDDPEVLYSVERSLRSPNLRVLSAASVETESSAIGSWTVSTAPPSVPLAAISRPP